MFRRSSDAVATKPKTLTVGQLAIAVPEAKACWAHGIARRLVSQHACKRWEVSGDELTTTAARQGKEATASGDQTRQSRPHDRTRNRFEDSTAIRRGLNCACFIEET